MNTFNFSSNAESNSTQVAIQKFNYASPVLNIPAEIARMTAVAASLVSLRILASIKSNNIVYKFITVISLVDIMYLGLMLMIRTTDLVCQENVAKNCPSIHYVFSVAFIWISDYLTSCLALFNILMEILITLERLFMISNYLPTMRNVTKVKLISFIIFAISFSVYIPVLFMKHVKLNPKQNPDIGYKQYQMAKTEFGETKTATMFMNSVNIFRVLLYTFVLLTLNSVIVHRFRRYSRRRQLYFENQIRKHISSAA
jgi:hypothetical protein